MVGLHSEPRGAVGRVLDLAVAARAVASSEAVHGSQGVIVPGRARHVWNLGHIKGVKKFTTTGFVLT